MKIDIHEEDGTWWADSPDAEGFFAAADSKDELQRLAREGLRSYLGTDVVVRDGSERSVSGWNLEGFINTAHDTLGVMSVKGNGTTAIKYNFPRVRDPLSA